MATGQEQPREESTGSHYRGLSPDREEETLSWGEEEPLRDGSSVPGREGSGATTHDGRRSSDRGEQSTTLGRAAHRRWPGFRRMNTHETPKERPRHFLRVRELEDSGRSSEPVPWYVIDQDETWRVLWDAGSTVIVVSLLFYLPYTMAFVQNGPTQTDFDWFIFAWFAIDIVLSFFTTYTYFGVKVTNLRQIVRRYVRGYFVVDVIATVPWGLVLEKGSFRLGPLAKSAKFPRLIRALRTLRLGKVVRSREFAKNVPDLSDVFPRLFPPIVEQLLRFLAVACVMNHVFACAWYALGSAPYDEECADQGGNAAGGGYPGLRGRRDCTWMQLAGYRPRSGNFYLYTTCLYWSLTTISTVGYGDIVPNTADEKIYTCCVMICGVSWYAVLVSSLGRALQAAARKDADHSKTALKTYLYRHKVPADLSAAIVSYLRHHFMVEHQFGENAQDSDPQVWRLLKHLNKPLTRALSLHVGRKSVQRVAFFKHKDQTFVADAVAAMRAYLASPLETLVPRSTVVAALNLIAQGSCAAEAPYYPAVHHDQAQRSNDPVNEKKNHDDSRDKSGKHPSSDRDEMPTSSEEQEESGKKHDDCPESPGSPARSVESLRAVKWHLKVGDYFGEEGLLLGAAWIEPLVADTWCELQIIPEIAIRQLLVEHPDVRDDLAETAVSKVTKYPTILTTHFAPHSVVADNFTPAPVIPLLADDSGTLRADDEHFSAVVVPGCAPPQSLRSASCPTSSGALPPSKVGPGVHHFSFGGVHDTIQGGKSTSIDDLASEGCASALRAPSALAARSGKAFDGPVTLSGPPSLHRGLLSHSSHGPLRSRQSGVPYTRSAHHHPLNIHKTLVKKDSEVIRLRQELDVLKRRLGDIKEVDSRIGSRSLSPPTVSHTLVYDDGRPSAMDDSSHSGILDPLGGPFRRRPGS